MSRTFTYTTSVRDIVRKRSAGKCERCGEPFRIRDNGLSDQTLHHRHKKEFGGKDSVTNLVNLHGSCHRALHACEDMAAEFGLILWAAESSWKPVAVMSEGHTRWVILTEDGGYDFIEGTLAGDLLGDCSRPMRCAKNHQPKTLRRAS